MRNQVDLGRRRLLLGVLFVVVCGAPAAWAAEATASSSQTGTAAAGALDGDRFSIEPGHVWKGAPGAGPWWWQCGWPEPRPIGAILQIVGDDPLRLQNAPRAARWQTSLDGRQWTDIAETAVDDERRTFRLQRLKAPRSARYLRLAMDTVHGSYPTLREIEVFADPQVALVFPEWIVAVSTVDKPDWDKRHPAGSEFVALARQCEGSRHLAAQHVWLDSFDESFVAAEPRPLAAFLSGNFSDWCQKDRQAWRGTQQVLTAGNLPMWASCGGAQGLAILADVGVDRPWDCPHCRDPNHPQTPIYTHIGHTGDGPTKCGHYETCVFERGPHGVLQTVADPVFAGLPRAFRVMQSHCGQIEYAPRGWVQIATKGSGAKTDMQCLRVSDRYVYAAQFHIEMDGTPEASRQIMTNFLGLARRWGGYNPHGEAAPAAP